jgi:hypothetical protein
MLEFPENKKKSTKLNRLFGSILDRFGPVNPENTLIMSVVVLIDRTN